MLTEVQPATQKFPGRYGELVKFPISIKPSSNSTTSSKKKMATPNSKFRRKGKLWKMYSSLGPLNKIAI